MATETAVSSSGAATNAEGGTNASAVASAARAMTAEGEGGGLGLLLDRLPDVVQRDVVPLLIPKDCAMLARVSSGMSNTHCDVVGTYERWDERRFSLLRRVVFHLERDAGAGVGQGGSADTTLVLQLARMLLFHAGG